MRGTQDSTGSVPRGAEGIRARGCKQAARGAVFVAAVAGLLAPAHGSAAVTVGTKLQPGAVVGQTFSCNAACTLTQSLLDAPSTAPGGLVAPIDGVVVRWRLQTGTSTSPMWLQVIDPGGVPDANAIVTGESSRVTPPANSISTFPARVPIARGDGIALRCCFVDSASVAITESHLRMDVYAPALAPGDPRRDATFDHPYKLMLNADIEPDCDADELGDETQDPALSGLRCSGGRRCAGRVPTHVGTARRDVLRGTPRRDVFLALGGPDRIVGRGGNDIACLGGGADRFFGGRGADRALGQRGADQLFGGPGRDRLFGGAGPDLIRGGPGFDRGNGGPGRDNVVL